MRRDEDSPDQLRRAEKSREDMRWDEMNWGDSPEKTRHEMRWDGTGWRRLRWQWDAMNSFQEKLRGDEIKWNEKRSNLEKTWHRNEKSRELLLRNTEGLPALYKHILCSAPEAIGASILKLPPPACPGTTCRSVRPSTVDSKAMDRGWKAHESTSSLLQAVLFQRCWEPEELLQVWILMKTICSQLSNILEP